MLRAFDDMAISMVSRRPWPQGRVSLDSGHAGPAGSGPGPPAHRPQCGLSRYSLHDEGHAVAGARHDGGMPAMNTGRPAAYAFSPLTPTSFLRRSAVVFRDRLAIVDGERRMTYGEFAQRSLADRIARRPRRGGRRQGSRTVHQQPIALRPGRLR